MEQRVCQGIVEDAAAICGALLSELRLRGDLLGNGDAPKELQQAAVGGTLILTGWLLLIMGIIARVFAAGFLGGALDLPLRGLFRVARLESAVAVSLAVLVAGIGTSIAFGRSAALFQLGLTLSNAAVGTIVVRCGGNSDRLARSSLELSSLSPSWHSVR